VRTLIAEAWNHDAAFGLLIEVWAVTGARASQVARLEIQDLQESRDGPRVLMPSSKRAADTSASIADRCRSR
jgi:hypothetical protein